MRLDVCKDAVYEELSRVIYDGFDMNAADKNGDSLLIKAVQLNMVDVVQRMIHFSRFGRPPHQKTLDLNRWTYQEGFLSTALHIAIGLHNKDIVSLLLRSGASIHKRDGDDKIALDLAYTERRLVSNQPGWGVLAQKARVDLDCIIHLLLAETTDRLFRELGEIGRGMQHTKVVDPHRFLPERDYYPRSAQEPFAEVERRMEDLIYKQVGLPIQSFYPRII